MANILYVMKYPLHESYTLKRKFDGQIAALKKMGHKVHYITFDRDRMYENCDSKTTLGRKILLGSIKAYIHTFVFIDIYLTAIGIINKHEIEFVYFRKSPLGIVGYTFLKKCNQKGIKVIVEIPSYPSKEKPGSLFRAIYGYYSRIWSHFSNKYVSLFALIGEKSDSYYGHPAINIENGITVENIPIRKYKADCRIHMLALASMSYWHGYDRILTSLHECTHPDAKRVIIDFVGNEGDGSLQKWKNMTSQLKLESQVVFHGRLEGEELDKMFDLATIGICSLGLYRLGYETSSILKLREYTARGLPFVYAANDSCINHSLGYAMKVSNNDNPINMGQIIDFANAVSMDTTLPLKMRKYAEESASWESQFLRLQQYFED